MGPSHSNFCGYLRRRSSFWAQSIASAPFCRSHAPGRGFIFAVVWSVVAWYLHWRLIVTMLPATGDWYEIGWLWICFAIELLAIAEQFILYLMFLRTTDRHAEADRHEARIRALPEDQLPSVDVFIPTYNEPIEVLEKTIIGALCLEYPNVKVWVLDDGRRHGSRHSVKPKASVISIGPTTRMPRRATSTTP